MHRNTTLCVGLLSVVICILVGCGGGAASSTSPSPPIVPSGPADLAKLSSIDTSIVPELQGGTLHVGSDISFPPIEFFPTGSNVPTGLDVDLAAALAQALGVKVTYLNDSFGNLFTGLNADKFDIAMSAITITSGREQFANFIPYFQDGTGIVVPRGNPKHIQTPQDLCGLRVGAQFDTVQVTQANAINCQSNAIDLTVFNTPTSAEALAALQNGTLDAFLEDFPSAEFDATQSNLAVVPDQFDVAPYGIAVRKTSPQLQQALTLALQAIHANGSYAAILQKWGLQGGAL